MVPIRLAFSRRKRKKVPISEGLGSPVDTTAMPRAAPWLGKTEAAEPQAPGKPCEAQEERACRWRHGAGGASLFMLTLTGNLQALGRLRHGNGKRAVFTSKSSFPALLFSRRGGRGRLRASKFYREAPAGAGFLEAT